MGRFTSKRIDTWTYRRAVVRYIDRNPVSAGIVPSAADYPYASARAYTGRAVAPAWLEQGWVREEVQHSSGLPHYDPRGYEEVFGWLPESLARVVEARWRHRSLEDPLDDLIRAAPDEVVRWMNKKAQLADGSAPGCPVVSVDSVLTSVNELPGIAAWKLGKRSGRAVLTAGLARQLGGARVEEIATLIGCSRSAASRYLQLHRESMIADAEYRLRAGEAAREALVTWSGATEVGGK